MNDYKTITYCPIDPDEANFMFRDKHVVFPAYPQPCTYVRIVDLDGNELAYWDMQEWVDEPEQVMGAIMGAIASTSKEIVKLIHKQDYDIYNG